MVADGKLPEATLTHLTGVSGKIYWHGGSWVETGQKLPEAAQADVSRDAADRGWAAGGCCCREKHPPERVV